MGRRPAVASPIDRERGARRTRGARRRPHQHSALSRIPLIAALTWLGLAALVLSACSEATVIRTHPPGASIYVNERYLGGSPAELEVDSWSVRPHAYRYRAVKPGYVESEGEVPARLSIGRIVAAYLSGCLSCGHGFYVFDEDTVVPLVPEAQPTDVYGTRLP